MSSFPFLLADRLPVQHAVPDSPILLRPPNCERAIAVTLIPEQRHIA
jgi:hypothetical protein